MKRSFTFLIAAMALMIAIMSPREAWGQGQGNYAGNFTKISSASDFTTGYYVVTASGSLTNSAYALGNSVNSNKRIEGVSVTITNNTISNPSNNIVYYITVNGTTCTFKNVGNSKYMYQASTTSGKGMGFSNDSQNITYVGYNSSSPTGFKFTLNGSSNNIFKYNDGSKWFANYTGAYTISMTPVELFKLSGYTVTYDCNGGTSGCPEDQSGITGGTEINLPAAPTKGCNTFAGWNDGTTTYDAGAAYTVNANVTMTAQWTPITYPVTYYPNNETTGEEIIENKTCGISYTIADNIFEYGEMTFTKWNTQADGEGTDYLAGATYSTDAALTLYAQWTSATLYTVMYDCDDATSGCPEPDIFNMEAGDLTLAAAPEKTGFTFNGWNDGTNTYAAGYTYNVTEDVTFTAQWLENLTAPTFNVTGVSTGAANTYYVTASVVISQSQEATIYYTTDGTTPTTSSTEYTEAIVVNTTGTTVVKALAVKSGYANSTVAEQTIIIVQPNVAEFTDGIYSETFGSSLGLWSAFNIAGNNVWSQGTVTVSSTNYTGANINGYLVANEDWLVSPKMVAVNGKLVIDFETAARYKLTSGNEDYKLAVKYSTDYVGYGNPTTYTWTALDPTIATPTSSSIVTAESGDVVISGLANNAEVYVAFIYTSGSSSGQATQYIISNFEAKQCYPVNYDANGGEGEMEDEDSPYAVGAEVTVLDNEFTAPDGKAFDKWNTQADGNGTDYTPESTFDMGTSAVTLYAQWSDPCTVTATMSATTAEYEYINDEGSLSYDINLGSSVSVLGGCDIYEYGYVYSTTEATPTLENGTKIQVGTTYETAETPFEETAIEDATLGATYYVRSFATNNAGTAYSEVAQVTVPAAYPTYTISYSTNGVAETPATINQGNSIGTLATPTAANIPNGYVFKGWSANDVALTDDEPTYVTAATIPTDNMNLKAVFAIASEGNPVETELSINTDNFTEITTDYTKTYTHVFTEATIEAYGVYKNAGIQMNKGKGTYIKNTTAMPGYISKIVLTWKASGKNSVTMYANSNSIASTSTDNLGEQSDEVTTQTINITNASTKAYKYFYLDGTTVTGACIMTNLSVFYMAPTTTYSNFTTSATALSGNLAESTTIANTAYYISDEAYVPANETVTINGVLGNANASLLIVNDGAQLIHSNAGVAATVKKNITGYGEGEGNYYFIAAPMASAVSTSGIATGTYDLYAYDEEQALWLNAKQEGSTFNTLNPQQGYLYANNATQDVSMAGTLNPSNEAMSYNLSFARATDDFKGFNLVGNPFACNASVNGSNSNAFYKMNEDGTEVEAVINPVVAPCTGIFALATDESQTVTFTKNTTGEPNVTRGLLTIAISKAEGRANKQVDRAIVSFDEISALPKFNINAGNSKLYIPQGNKNFAVVNAEAEGSLPLCFEANQRGNYTISVSTENLNVEYLHLIDNMTGADTDLLVEESYSFSSKTTDYASRFKLVFKANAQNDEMNEVESSFAYISNGELIVSNEGRATLQVIDMMGRVLRSQTINGDCRISVNGMTAGVYVLNLNGKTQKIVVR